MGKDISDFLVQCDECGWEGNNADLETTELPEGVFDKCPECGAPEDSIRRID